jgi:hypothetical protein
MDHNTGLPAKAGLRLAFTVWAVGSCVAGLADAMISTVAYSQAAAIGQRFTHVSGGCLRWQRTLSVRLRRQLGQRWMPGESVGGSSC